MQACAGSSVGRAVRMVSTLRSALKVLVYVWVVVLGMQWSGCQ